MSLVEDVVGAAAAAAEKAGVALRTSQVDEAVVEGSPASLRRALTALVDNAVDHAERRGRRRPCAATAGEWTSR